MDSNSVTRWVVEQTALLEPPAGWQPDAGAALTRLHARMDASARPAPRLWLRWVLAGSLACAALAMLPPTRSLAQQLWQFLKIGRLDLVRLDLKDIPKDSSLNLKLLQPPQPSAKVRDADEARLRVGYAPRLPQPGILAGSPQLSTTGAMTFGTVLKAADLEQLLRREGVADLPVPLQWDGARIVLDIHPIVTAEWQDITLMQSLPPVIAAPSGFDFPLFLGAVLRGLGVPRDQALRLARQGPALMLPIELDEAVAIREVQLRTGPGTMVYDLDDNGRIERLTLTWSVADRIYVLSGVMSDSLAINAANSIQ